jgi:hypothetical protein
MSSGDVKSHVQFRDLICSCFDVTGRRIRIRLLVGRITGVTVARCTAASRFTYPIQCIRMSIDKVGTERYCEPYCATPPPRTPRRTAPTESPMDIDSALRGATGCLEELARVSIHGTFVLQQPR